MFRKIVPTFVEMALFLQLNDSTPVFLGKDYVFSEWQILFEIADTYFEKLEIEISPETRSLKCLRINLPIITKPHFSIVKYLYAADVL